MAQASEKTVSRLEVALGKHEIDDDMSAQIKSLIANGISQTAASGFIGLVESLPERPVVKAARENKVEVPGYYAHDGVPLGVVKVQRSQKGFLYACEARPGGQWKFVSGLVSQIDKRRACEKPQPIAASRADIEAALRAASA